MKGNFFLVAVFIFCGFSGFTQELRAVYNTDFKEMTLIRKGSNISGTYAHRNGRVEGTLNGNTLTGLWYQDNGKGKMVFEFNDDFSSFTGKWGYNDANPSSKWNGTRISGSIFIPGTSARNIEGEYQTDFNVMNLTQQGNFVKGTYQHRNGRIEGELRGHTLSGRWYQDNGKGRFIFEFSDDFSAFTGKWGYNESEPASKWNGTRTGTVSNLHIPVTVAAPVLSGTFNTDFKNLTFSLDGNKVKGNYEHRNGRIEGDLKGHTLTGWWYQDNGKGRFVFEFNDDFSEFTGKWGYNDASPSSKWNGIKIIN